jgi:hypothetical protein
MAEIWAEPYQERQVCVFESNLTTYARVGVPAMCNPGYLRAVPPQFAMTTAQEAPMDLGWFRDAAKC